MAKSQPKAPEMPAVDPPVEDLPAVDWDTLPIDVYERRLVGLEDQGSAEIALTIPGDWYCRWVNTDLAGRWSQVVHRMGYVPVRASEIADPRAVAGLVITPEGVVARGDRGKEVLVRMPRDYYERIKRAQADARRARAKDSQRFREELSQAVAGNYGDQAAETVAGWKGTLSETLERHE